MDEGALIFLKLGGSLITDKTVTERLRPEILKRVAEEIAAAREKNLQMRLVLGHGSGSFGHVAAAKHDTRKGVKTAAEWHGFAEVSDAALRLNRHVRGALLEGGVPVISLSPSASVYCEDGVIQEMAFGRVQDALDAGLVPLIHGDVAFDGRLGGTIVSTEEVMTFLADHLDPHWLLLAGETAGVYDSQKVVIPKITDGNFEQVKIHLGGSRGTDVTGGMLSKVQGMLDLVTAHPMLSIKIFSGGEAGLIERLLLEPASAVGTLIYTAGVR